MDYIHFDFDNFKIRLYALICCMILKFFRCIHNELSYVPISGQNILTLLEAIRQKTLNTNEKLRFSAINEYIQNDRTRPGGGIILI